MSHEGSPDRIGATLENLCQHWETEARRKASTLHLSSGESCPKDFTITLAREAGTQGSGVAREVGKRLDWHVYDHELLERIARELHWRTSLLESIDEKRMSWLEEAMQAFQTMSEADVSAPLLSESAYVRHLVQTILALGAHGACVIVGRGAGHILPPATTLRVRLVAPSAERTNVVSKRLGISQREAARKVKAIDRERSHFVRDHFLKDPEDPANHDLVLNAARFSIAECADLMIEGLHQLQARLGPKIVASASV